MSQEPHVCRGLNTCKGKAQSGKNDCAGQGDCATAKAHTCAGDNDCAGLGGCDNKSTRRARTSARAWAAAPCRSRTRRPGPRPASNFEADMKKACPDKKIGEAPPAKDK